MFVSHRDINYWHLVTGLCQRVEERKQLRLAEDEARVGASTAITAYRIPLATVSSFKCIGRVLSFPDYYWLAVVQNLCRARQKWARLTRVLVIECVDAHTS